MKTLASHSLNETKQIAKNWLVSISNTYANHNGALIVGLSGHLGAGKTAFTKSVAEVLGITDHVTSPTFVIMKIYEINDQVTMTNDQKARHVDVPWRKLIHIDAYRLEGTEQLQVLEWEKLLADRDNLILIEWPENVGLQSFHKDTSLAFEASDGVHHISIK
ncbi:MAG: tRNA (adenosine(37)-N6)-threonylcarbamoyltransferase complex ATPase subunit type 1 TsaE [Patescibacteria group bacterium]